MSKFFVDEQQFYVFIDALLYVLTSIYFIWKKKTINVGIFILLIMTISHVGAIFYYNVLNNLGIAMNITIPPFIYLYLTIMLSIYPLIKYDGIEIVDAGRNQKLIAYFVYFVCLMTIIPLAENVMLVLKNGLNADYGSVYEDKMDQKLSIYSNLTNNLNRWLNYFRVIIFGIFFWIISFEKKNKWLIAALLICISNYILYAINTSTRAYLLCHFFLSGGCFLLLKKTYSITTRYNIRKMLLVFASIAFFFMAFITISRYNVKSQKSIYEWVLLYVSEGPIKFNNEMWDANHNTNGDVNLTLLKDLLNEKTYLTYQDRDEYYLMKNGRRIEVFYTYVGDFLSDFDYIGAFICCLLLFLIEVNILKKQKNISFEAYIIICFLINLYVIGFASNMFRSYTAQRGIFYSMLFLLLLFILRKLKNRQHNYIVS